MRALGAIFVVLIVAWGALASERKGAGVAVGSVVAVIPLAAAPTAGLTASDTAVWVPSDPDGALAHLDPGTNQVSATIHMGPTPTCSLCWGAVAADEGGVWTTSTSARLAVVKIDPVLNRVTTSLPLSIFPSDSRPVLLVAAMMLLLVMAWLRRGSFQLTTYAQGHDGPHMSDLQRFAENRTRAP